MQIFLISLALVSCAPKSTDQSTAPPGSVVASSAYILNGTEKVAYVFDIYSDDATVYVPSVDRYSMINLTSGLYFPSFVVFAGASCTGEKRTDSFFGPIGKATIVDSSANYYRVVSKVSGVFNYQSFRNGLGGCTNQTSFLDPSYTLEAATQPFNFQPLAPISLQFQ